MTKNCNKIAFLTDHSLLFLFSIHTPSLSEIVTVEWLIWLWNAMKAYTTKLKHFLSTCSFQNNFYSAHKNYTKMCTQCKASSVNWFVPLHSEWMGKKREMLIVPNKWHAVIMYYHLCEKHTASELWLHKNQTPPPFQRSIFLKPYFQWEGLNVKLNKRKSLTSTLLHTMWVPDHSIHHPMQTPTNGEGRGCMMGCSKGRQVRDTEHTNNIQTTHHQTACRGYIIV